MSGTFPLAFSVTSGKGGVGKTNISINLAISLARLGKRVVLLDADFGLANVDVLLGLTPKKNILDLLQGASLRDILFPTPYGFSMLPASSGSMLSLSTGQKFELLELVSELEDDLDYLITDTGAGIGDNVRYFNLAAQERLLILTPEPTSLTDAYALIKVLKQAHDVESFKICVNMTPNEKDAKNIFMRLHHACEHFLSGVSLDLAGIIPRDTEVRKAVIRQLPFCIGSPGCEASKALARLAATISEWEVPKHLDGNIKFFWKKLLFREN
ncbi:MAG: flagellar synthesis regulatory protein [Candidatus Desulfovibrio kirbyi]|jgi:flagellar biosynthesis protein FlhG|uniref:Flagellar synthesis regulatory protein n=1 Tax=Candidatus Desulfovibrio kirbyi TaxID=2696086 RepID=A0A6L2R4W5_9BACT|nr:MinD/ParA family protein [Desulfovibrio sp.]GFH62492.1 MAG: flagellar synthesis regulatory protein [Candidatus Desulfovibrio kirbyi]